MSPKKYRFLAYISLIINVLHAQSDSVRTRIYLIGDTGKKAVVSKNYLKFSQAITQDKPSCVLFLGDNVYPKGIRPEGDKNHQEDVQKLHIQLGLLKNHKGQFYMIPGNHDWAMGQTSGLTQVKRERDLVNQYIKDSLPQYSPDQAHYYKPTGLPGPEKVELEGITIIMVDTDWWVHNQIFHKVDVVEKSNKKTEKLFFEQFDTYLKEANDKGNKIFVMTHHPLYLSGKNAKPMQPLRFLVNYTPFAIFGVAGLYRAARGMSPQPSYKRMVRKFEKHIAPYKQVIWVSGHDHDQQLNEKNNVTQIVCGNGGEHVKVENRPKMTTWHNDETTGFGKIELSNSGILTVFFYDDNGKELYRQVIK